MRLYTALKFKHISPQWLIDGDKVNKENIASRVFRELERHVPFTFFGAVTGIIIMTAIVYGDFVSQVNLLPINIFFILHPTHVFLSAIVTTALYVKYGKRKWWAIILIGYIGSIGIATISDSVIPYVGEILLDLPNAGIHIGFIEKPIITNIPAILGIVLGYYYNAATKIPHAGHVLISTWASLFHVLMAVGTGLNTLQMAVVFMFLFLAVWIPCCTSDIMFPMLFKPNKN